MPQYSVSHDKTLQDGNNKNDYYSYKDCLQKFSLSVCNVSTIFL